MMNISLQIKLVDGWSDYSYENPDGPATFLRDRSEVPGPLQVSYAIYKDGPKPDPSKEDLIEFCIGLGKQHGFGELVKTDSMSCAFGLLGTAVFRGEELAHVQVWYLTNGRDIITATHICPEVPEQEEVTEVQGIVSSITLATVKPKWKFW